MFKKLHPCGIGYDKRCNKLRLTFFRDGYTYYAFDMSKEDFDDFYESGKWEKYTLPRHVKKQVQQCEHDLIYFWNETGKCSDTYCKKCNYNGFIDNRTKEDMDAMWANAYKNDAKQSVIEAKRIYETLLKEYEEKYNESPFKEELLTKS